MTYVATASGPRVPAEALGLKTRLVPRAAMWRYGRIVFPSQSERWNLTFDHSRLRIPARGAIACGDACINLMAAFRQKDNANA